MAMRNALNAQIKSDLVNFNSAIDGQAYILLGESAMGDRTCRLYFYDASSSATADGDNVLSATGMGGTGRFIKSSVEGALYPGSVSLWTTNSAPSGWLICDGSSVSRITYATLFAAIGTTYGMGDGSTTFNIPDCRQRFPLGKASSGTGSALGDTGGTINHDHGSPITTSQPSATTNNIGLLGVEQAASETHTHSVDLTAENPPFIVFNFIIKT